MAQSHASDTPKPDSPGVALIPPTVFYVCLIGGAALALWHGWYGWSFPFVVLGLAIAFVGFAFMGWANGQFKSLGVSVKTRLPASRLVTKGAFRFSRNPMYVGFVAILMGLGLAAGSIPMMASAIPMYLYLDWYVIPREESYLARAFGADYAAYCRKVRRWV